MADMPVYYVSKTAPYYKAERVSFYSYPGTTAIQKQRNTEELHERFKARHKNARLLEISRYSEELLGVLLDDKSLSLSMGKKKAVIESAFYAGKVFRGGGPYTDLLSFPPRVVKKDPRLHESGKLMWFALNGWAFPSEPQCFFYDWLYINAVWEKEDLAEKICEYNAFTDAEFNPEEPACCQARSAAIFVSLCACGKIKKALLSPKKFMEEVYEIKCNKTPWGYQPQ